MLLSYGQLLFDVQKQSNVKIIGSMFTDRLKQVEFKDDDIVNVINLKDNYRDGKSKICNLREIDSLIFLEDDQKM